MFDDIGIKSIFKTNQTLIFTKKSFFYTILEYIQSQSRALGDIEGFNQLTPGSYKCDKPINITNSDEVHINCDFVDGSVLNGVRQPILYSFALDKPPERITYKEPRIKLFEKINKHVLSHEAFYSEDDDHKAVDFNEETVNFNCQLIKLK